MTEKKQNFKKINFNQAKKIRAWAVELIKKNPLYKIEDLERAWGQFEHEQNLIKHGQFVKMLQGGNLKLSNIVGIWDMPAIITCQGACMGCYALKAERLYKNTRVMRLRHLLHVLYAVLNPIYKKYFINNMVVNCRLYPIIRLHGAGDMFHEGYLKIWLSIIEKTPKTKFYTYTKILKNSRIDYFNNKYKNFNIIKSIIELDNKFYINFGTSDYIKNLKNELKKQGMPCFICNYQNMEHHTCMIDCKKCLSCPHVLFQKH